MRKKVTIYFILLLASANALAGVQDLGHVSEFVDRKCNSTVETSPQTRLACLWTEDVRKILNYENGRRFEDIHSLWVRSLRHRLQSNDSAAFAPEYFEYLSNIQYLQIESLYLLYKLQMNWKTAESVKFANAVIQFLAERIPTADVGRSLYSWRINRNLNELFKWKFDTDGKDKTKKALITWLSDPQNVLELQSLVSSGGTSELTFRSALITSVFAESVPGTVSTNPIEYLYRESNNADFFYGLTRTQVATDWLAVRQAAVTRAELQRATGLFAARIPIEIQKVTALTSCEWFESTLTEAAGAFSVKEIVDDCKDAAEKRGRGLNFWSALGIGFEKTTPSIERLNTPLRTESIKPDEAQKVKLLQIGFWLFAVERTSAVAGTGNPVRELETLSALRAFLELREGLESVHEFYLRNKEERP